jgi:hypothetical protein
MLVKCNFISSHKGCQKCSDKTICQVKQKALIIVKFMSLQLESPDLGNNSEVKNAQRTTISILFS